MDAVKASDYPPGYLPAQVKPARMSKGESLIARCLVGKPPLFESDIYKALAGQLDGGAIRRNVAKMERHGYLVTQASATDPLARRHIILTPFGKGALERSVRYAQLDAFAFRDDGDEAEQATAPTDHCTIYGCGRAPLEKRGDFWCCPKCGASYGRNPCRKMR